MRVTPGTRPQPWSAGSEWIIRTAGGFSPSVTRARSPGARPANSAAIRAVAAAASVKSRPANHSPGRASWTYAWITPPASRWAVMPLPGVSAYIAPSPTAAAVPG